MEQKNYCCIQSSTLADDWYLYDNSASDYQLVAKNISGEKEISNFDLYNKIAGDNFLIFLRSDYFYRHSVFWKRKYIFT